MLYTILVFVLDIVFSSSFMKKEKSFQNVSVHMMIVNMERLLNIILLIFWQTENIDKTPTKMSREINLFICYNPCGLEMSSLSEHNILTFIFVMDFPTVERAMEENLYKWRKYHFGNNNIKIWVRFLVTTFFCKSCSA